ncbi:hypothetical protein O181_048205 [Austropuccinia psidii MF-1]|uniref:Uncharacterized protein n=1 Tax=Austropuccinia psidii MF-1 TaxID=1389203 RepID=A0A9Q3DWT2_9BASI|nr:hypothetical protein [Austropuccinia psidii MF-1]
MSWSKAQCGSFWWSHDWNTFCNSSLECSGWRTSAKRVKCSSWQKCLPVLCKMLRICAYRDDLAIAHWGAFDIAISIAQKLCNSNVQKVRMSIMTPKQTGAIVNNLNSLVFRCRAHYALSGVSPECAPQQQPMLVMVANKHTRNCHLFSTLLSTQPEEFPPKTPLQGLLCGQQ